MNSLQQRGLARTIGAVKNIKSRKRLELRLGNIPEPLYLEGLQPGHSELRAISA